MPDDAARYYKAQGNSQSTTVQDQRPTLRELHLMASLFLQWLVSAQKIFVLKVVLVAGEADILSHDGQGQGSPTLDSQKGDFEIARCWRHGQFWLWAGWAQHSTMYSTARLLPCVIQEGQTLHL